MTEEALDEVCRAMLQRLVLLPQQQEEDQLPRTHAKVKSILDTIREDLGLLQAMEALSIGTLYQCIQAVVLNQFVSKSAISLSGQILQDSNGFYCICSSLMEDMTAFVVPIPCRHPLVGLLRSVDVAMRLSFALDLSQGRQLISLRRPRDRNLSLISNDLIKQFRKKVPGFVKHAIDAVGGLQLAFDPAVALGIMMEMASGLRQIRAQYDQILGRPADTGDAVAIADLLQKYLDKQKKEAAPKESKATKAKKPTHPSDFDRLFVQLYRDSIEELLECISERFLLQEDNNNDERQPTRKETAPKPWDALQKQLAETTIDDLLKLISDKFPRLDDEQRPVHTSKKQAMADIEARLQQQIQEGIAIDWLIQEIAERFPHQVEAQVEPPQPREKKQKISAVQTELELYCKIENQLTNCHTTKDPVILAIYEVFSFLENYGMEFGLDLGLTFEQFATHFLNGSPHTGSLLQELGLSRFDLGVYPQSERSHLYNDTIDPVIFVVIDVLVEAVTGYSTVISQGCVLQQEEPSTQTISSSSLSSSSFSESSYQSEEKSFQSGSEDDDLRSFSFVVSGSGSDDISADGSFIASDDESSPPPRPKPKSNIIPKPHQEPQEKESPAHKKRTSFEPKHNPAEAGSKDEQWVEKLVYWFRARDDPEFNAVCLPILAAISSNPLLNQLFLRLGAKELPESVAEWLQVVYNLPIEADYPTEFLSTLGIHVLPLEKTPGETTAQRTARLGEVDKQRQAMPVSQCFQCLEVHAKVVFFQWLVQQVLCTPKFRSLHMRIDQQRTELHAEAKKIRQDLTTFLQNQTARLVQRDAQLAELEQKKATLETQAADEIGQEYLALRRQISQLEKRIIALDPRPIEVAAEQALRNKLKETEANLQKLQRMAQHGLLRIDQFGNQFVASKLREDVRIAVIRPGGELLYLQDAALELFLQSSAAATWGVALRPAESPAWTQAQELDIYQLEYCYKISSKDLNDLFFQKPYLHAFRNKVLLSRAYLRRVTDQIWD